MNKQIVRTLGIVSVAFASVAYGDALQFVPSPVGTWIFQSHRGSFTLHLSEGGACEVRTVEADESSVRVPCAWSRSDAGLVTVTRASLRMTQDSPKPTLEATPAAPVQLQYDAKDDSMQFRGASMWLWLQRVE
jgi:hypothetical protein